MNSKFSWLAIRKITNVSTWMPVLTVAALSVAVAIPASAFQELRSREEAERELLQTDDPPWIDSGDTPRLPAVAQTTPMDALVGVEASEFERLIDGDPLEHEDETVLKILFRVPQMGLDSVARFVKQTEGTRSDDIIADPETNRALMFRINGMATHVERLLVRPELAERYEYTHFYRVQVQIDNDQPSVVVLARQVPKHWPLDESISEPVRIDSLFLRLVEDERVHSNNDESNLAPSAPTDESGIPLLIARHIGWFPEQGNHVGEAFADGVYWLSSFGLDCSLWEPIAQSDKKSLGAADSECFYQGLAAIQRANESEAERPSSQELEIFTLLKSYSDFRGERFRIRGNVRRITRVEVGQAYFSERTGIDHYFQIDMFVKLEDHQIITQPTSDGRKGPVFKNKYPITICVPSLPDGLEPTDDINVQVTAEGHFFKLWAYPSQYVEQFDPNIRQIGPLFVGHELVVEEGAASPNTLTIVAAVVLIGSLGGAWIGAWALGRRDAKPIRKTEKDEGDPEWLKTLEEQERSTGSTSTDSP